MFVYLTKKISIPNGSKACSLSWDNDSGLLAVGSSDSMIRILKLDSPGLSGPSQSNEESGNSAGKTSLSVSQTLATHKGQVILSSWNRKFKKLTTADSSGLIIVWALQQGPNGPTWKEDMFNSRNGVQVTYLAWSRDCKKIVITYQDGMVVMGDVDGTRLWGKTLMKSGYFSKAAWSPDGKNILFSTKDGELQLFDAEGNFLAKIIGLEKKTISSMEWYDDRMGHSDGNLISIAISYDNGKMVLYKDARDDNPLVIETGLSDVRLGWNHNGTILAVFGNRSPGQDQKSYPLVSFYNNQGLFIRSLRFGANQSPASSFSNTGISWDYSGSRFVVAMDSYLYFANVYQDYKWYYALDSIVFAYEKHGESKSSICFWNILTQEKILKSLSSLKMIIGWEDQLALISKNVEAESESFNYTITLANAIGVFLDVKIVNLVPSIACMNRNHVYVTDGTVIYYWQYKDQNLKSVRKLNIEGSKRQSGKERYFAVEDLCQTEKQRTSFEQINVEAKNSIFGTKTENPVVSMSCSEKYLVLGRSNGEVVLLNVPHLFIDRVVTRLSEPARLMSINCDDSKLAIGDIMGTLKLFPINENDDNDSAVTQFERKDVWDFRWALDNRDMLAVMEKNRLFVFRGLEPEEPLFNYGYLCEFKDLQIKLVKINEILSDPENPDNESLVLVETKLLRDCRNILSQNGLQNSCQFIESNSHPRLWKLFADSALEELELEMAMKGFVRSMDYYGISVVKNLRRLTSDEQKKAEVSLYFSEFENAETTYLEMDRKDLAIQMRKKLGDWFRVLQLMKSGGYAEDETLEYAWNSIGDYYYDRRQWVQASEFYNMSKNYTRLLDCYYFDEDFESLRRLTERLPDNTPILRVIAERFSSVGLCYEASLAMIKLSEIQNAINLCINNHRWNTAIQIAEKYQYADLDGLLYKYAEHLVSSGKILESVELFRKSNYPQKSAQWLLQVVEDLKSKLGAKAFTYESVLLKKLYVLAGLETERWRAQNRRNKGVNKIGQGSSVEDEDMKEIGFFHSSRKTIPLKNAWRGAISLHYLMLSERLFHQRRYVDSMRAILYIREYDDILDPKIIYKQVALSALHANYLGVASKALSYLQNQAKMDDNEIQGISEIAKSVYSRNAPVNPKSENMACTSCGSQMKHYETSCPTCEQTYQVSSLSAEILTGDINVSCIFCKQSIAESETKFTSICKVCHQPLILDP